MKKFNLEEAKAGKPVCTRDGRKARILAFDLKGYNGRSIVAAVTDKKDNCEITPSFYSDGRLYKDSITSTDLMMATKKKKGWINVYKTMVYKNGAAVSRYIYETEELAKQNSVDKDYIGTFPVEWEE